MLTQHFVLGYFRQVPVGLISLTANEPALIATSYFDGHGQAPDPVGPLGCDRLTAFIEAIGLDQPQTQSPPNVFAWNPRGFLGANGDWASWLGQANSFVDRL